MEKVFGKHWLETFVIEIIGSLLTAVGLYNFAMPAGFPVAGISGLALIIHRLAGLPVGLMTALLNVPIALLCYRIIGHRFFFRSVRCILISSLFVDYVAPLFPVYAGTRLIAAVCAGVLGGIGYAIIYLVSSSTGGTDFIVMAIKARHQHISLGKVIFCADALIILAGGIIFHDFDGIVYGLMINYIYAFAADKILYGMNAGKLSLIITDKGEEVCRSIDSVCARGTTLISARGGYTGQEHDMVICACSSREMIRVEQAAQKVDKNAFTVVLESSEVMGNGFRLLRVAEPGE